MYTQCPDCETAFRVTARDLQRAAGRVACIGCSREFNALERLSEDAPASGDNADDARDVLESLNELTGPHEIRIEDTGVEWRVIEEDDLAEAGDDAGLGDESYIGVAEGEPGEDSTGSVRWYIDDAQDPVQDPLPDPAQDSLEEPADPAAQSIGNSDDEPASEPEPVAAATTGAPVDEAFENAGQENADQGRAQKSLELSDAEGEDQQRYDDNTPLPDDFRDEGESHMPQRRAEDRIEPRSPEADEAQVDLALGEPDDWVELLDEVGQRNDPDSRLPGQPPQDAVSLGSGPNSPGSGEDDVLEQHDELDDTDVRPLEANDVKFPDDSFPSDIDTQFDLQAIELGIDLTGSHPVSSGTPGDSDAAGPPQSITKDRAEGTSGVREQDLATDGLEDVALSRPNDDSDDNAWGGRDDSYSVAGSASDEDAEERLREEAFERELEAAWAITLDDNPTGPRVDAPANTEVGPASDAHVVPPPTEEEMTINLQIDQELIRLAEKQEVFTATQSRRRNDAPHVETIIMEGDFVRNALEEELLAARSHESDAATEDGQPATSADTGDIMLDPYNSAALRGGRRRSDPASYRVLAGVTTLALVLAAQVVHAYRDTLATYALFDATVGSVYRLLGEPVVPDWNITGWQFESTNGRADEGDEVLTISSRVANRSEKSLPYPLLHVSLTDRWEEIIGSKLLDPAEYLPASVDSSSRISPGDDFTAVVRVEAPAPQATGFKLNVCYREASEQLRCATQDFKN